MIANGMVVPDHADDLIRGRIIEHPRAMKINHAPHVALRSQAIGRNESRGDWYHVGFALAAIAWLVAFAVWISVPGKLRLFLTR